MRLHSDTLTQSDLRDAASVAGVRFVRHNSFNSRSKARGFDVVLTGTAPYRTQADRDEYAATWDEWGIFFNVLFDRDPEMVAGNKGWGYRNEADFHYRTDGRFESLTRQEQHRRHKWHPNGDYSGSCECGALFRWPRP